MAFQAWTLGGSLYVPAWALPVLGFLFLPWTTMAYLFVWPGGITLFDWVIILIGLLLDMSAHGGGGAAYRRRRSDY
jgi:hypothetical protein